MAFDIDADFTGSRMQYVTPEIVRVSMPVKISIQTVDNITKGRITQTYFDWVVTMEGREIARRDIHSTRPRTRNAAIGQAKRAVRAYRDYLASRPQE
jgi:ABC-type sulfate transport system substrate-binding protein